MFKARSRRFRFMHAAGFTITPRVPEPFAEPIDASTRYCAVYGCPVRHSASPAMQNAGIGALGLNWRYLAFEVNPADLRQAIAGAAKMGFMGLNLTVPHKLLALEMVDEVDPPAREWGAVNTIVFEGRSEDGSWNPLREFSSLPHEIRSHGFNTDAEAIVRAIREDLMVEIAGASVLVLGAGGAGRTAALKLAAEGAGQLHLVNRTASKAEAVANEIRERFPSVKVRIGYPGTAVDLALNATSLGLKADDPLPLSVSDYPLGKARAVYDMIYRPAKTGFLRAAHEAGCQTANGLGMLLYQGTRALELWTGQRAPVSAMRQALEKNVYGD
jgi:shikimate dehydrogenase